MGGGGGTNSNDKRFWEEFDRLNQMQPSPGAAMPMASGVGVGAAYRNPLESDMLDQAGLAHAAAAAPGMGLPAQAQPFFTPAPRPAPVAATAWRNPDDEDNGPLAALRRRNGV